MTAQASPSDARKVLHEKNQIEMLISTLSSVSELALLMDLSLLILVLDFCILLGEGGWMWRRMAGGGSPVALMSCV